MAPVLPARQPRLSEPDHTWAAMAAFLATEAPPQSSPALGGTGPRSRCAVGRAAGCRDAACNSAH